MYSQVFNNIKDVRPGSYNWKIKVRVIRFWRGVSKTGETFKGFNLLLLDDKGHRLHAFVPGMHADAKMEEIEVGKIYSIGNFTVKEYKADERFRCIRNDKQIIFTNFTKVEEIEDDDSLIKENMFDFFDLSDLKDIANKNIYLTDVVGVIEKELPLRHFRNRNGEAQSQIKFPITDGRCSVNVTMWDAMAEEFAAKLSEDLEYPRIVIIASAKITSWQDADKVDISNVTATKFYINYSHHSVIQMRQMLKTPLFSNYDFASQQPETVLQFSATEILSFGSESIKKEVICDVKVKLVHDTLDWYVNFCTSCYKKIEIVDGYFKCVNCNRNVPYPEKRFSIITECFDCTGNIDIILDDREVRTLIGKTAFEVDKETTKNKFPKILKTIENREFRVKLLVKKINVEKKCNMFLATGIYEKTMSSPNKFIESSTQDKELQESLTQGSASTYHLDGMSQLSFKSPEVEKKGRPRRLIKKKVF